jgi:putative Holliday junction resolvase
MGRILSIDLGERRVGLAISDETQTIAQGLDTINFDNEPDLIEQLKRIIQERMVSEIVIGYPLSLSSQETKRSIWVKTFLEKLQKQVTIPIKLFDERLTSLMAERFLEEANQTRRGTSRHHRPSHGASVAAKIHKQNKVKQVIDKLAATIILEDYLNSKQRDPR